MCLVYWIIFRCMLKNFPKGKTSSDRGKGTSGFFWVPGTLCPLGRELGAGEGCSDGAHCLRQNISVDLWIRIQVFNPLTLQTKKLLWTVWKTLHYTLSGIKIYFPNPVNKMPGENCQFFSNWDICLLFYTTTIYF